MTKTLHDKAAEKIIERIEFDIDLYRNHFDEDWDRSEAKLRFAAILKETYEPIINGLQRIRRTTKPQKQHYKENEIGPEWICNGCFLSVKGIEPNSLHFDNCPYKISCNLLSKLKEP